MENLIWLQSLEWKQRSLILEMESHAKYITLFVSGCMVTARAKAVGVLSSPFEW